MPRRRTSWSKIGGVLHHSSTTQETACPLVFGKPRIEAALCDLVGEGVAVGRKIRVPCLWIGRMILLPLELHRPAQPRQRLQVVSRRLAIRDLTHQSISHPESACGRSCPRAAGCAAVAASSARRRPGCHRDVAAHPAIAARRSRTAPDWSYAPSRACQCL